jgi:hypothetical protein
MWNQDTTGVTLTKAPPRLANLDLVMFQDAVTWVKNQLLPHGYEAKSASLDTSLEIWNFYDARGEILVRVPHDLIERAYTAIIEMNRLKKPMEIRWLP